MKLDSKKSAVVVCAFLIVQMTLTTTALNLEVVVADYNTLNPLENATVKIYNSTDLVNEDYTDLNGIVNFSLVSDNYTIVTSMLSYDTDNRDTELDSDDSVLITMIPFSPTGIIRFRYSDLTGIRISDWFGDNHEICIYFSANNRLQDCYVGNETIQLLQEQSYIIKIKPTRQDMLNAPDSLLIFTKQYTRYFVMLIFLISVIGVLYYVQKNYIFN